MLSKSEMSTDFTITSKKEALEWIQGCLKDVDHCGEPHIPFQRSSRQSDSSRFGKIIDP